MADYVTLQMLQAFARESEGLDSNEAWTLLAGAASRAFDAVCEVAPGFFSEAADEPSQKVFRGDGTAWMKLAPYRPGTLDLEESFLNDSDPLPDETEERGEQGLQYLFLDGGEWDDNIKATLVAEWGFEKVPEDVQFATVQIALLMWRQSDVSFAGIANADTQLVLRELPPMVRAVAEKYRAKYGASGVFA